jgi:CRP-like cAMP-binding protein
VLFLIKGRLETPDRPVDGSVRRYYGVGDVVGEVEFVQGLGGDESVRQAHVEAAEASAVAALSAHKLNLLAALHPELAWHILKVRKHDASMCRAHA